jgi:hypothetical protein
MKMKFLAFVALSASIAVVSCKGDKGELGPQGPQGPQGTSGTAGVKYSNWIRVTDANWTQTKSELVSGGDSTIYYSATIATPEVTQDVLDKGVVVYYLKDATPFGRSAVRNFDPYNAWYDWIEVGTSNRTLEQQKDEYGYYSKYWIFTDSADITKGNLTIGTRWQGGAVWYNPSNWEYRYLSLKQKYSELKPKTDFYIRYVVIPAGTLIGGRKAPVDLKNYDAVKSYYHIKD